MLNNSENSRKFRFLTSTQIPDALWRGATDISGFGLDWCDFNVGLGSHGLKWKAREDIDKSADRDETLLEELKGMAESSRPD
jgi:hypothetical protein